MSMLLALTVALNCLGTAIGVEEPDGSRTLGIVPPFRGEPAPPAWLRARSHAVAAVRTRHYIYEAYAGPGGRWLVRYLLLPEEGEPSRDLERAYLFGSDEKKRPARLKASELRAQGRGAAWKGLDFTLVDRRDLMRP